MAQEFINRVFDGLHEFDTGRTHRDARFIGCTFQSCSVGLSTEDLSKRIRLINSEVTKCSISSSMATAVIVEDVLIDGLKTAGLFQTWAAVFKHVTLKGKIDRMMLSDLFNPVYPDSKFQQVIAKANADYYATVDWALDIRQAEFKDFDCRGVPSRLVRRDPETQVMITRDKALANGAGEIAKGNQVWQLLLRGFLGRDTYSDVVMVAPKRHPQFKELVAGFNELRRVGVIEPD